MENERVFVTQKFLENTFVYTSNPPESGTTSRGEACCKYMGTTVTLLLIYISACILLNIQEAFMNTSIATTADEGKSFVRQKGARIWAYRVDCWQFPFHVLSLYAMWRIWGSGGATTKLTMLQLEWTDVIGMEILKTNRALLDIP